MTKFNPTAYKLFDVIGKGSYGKVYRSLDPSGKIIAVKMIDIEASDLNETLLEITFLRKLKHKNILQLYNAELVSTTVWLCTEYCAGGSLHRVLKTHGAFKETCACYVLNSLLRAIEFTHGQGIIHRDIKPANIFIDSEVTIKLGDFGVSAQLTNTRPERETMIGTPYWMAPEVISQSFYGAPADIWGVGIIAIELVTGKTPWADVPPTKAMMQIVRDEAPTLSRAACTHTTLLSVNFVSLVRQCVVKDPTKRQTAKVLANQRWLNRFDSPPREFRHLVRDHVARHTHWQGRCSRVSMIGQQDSEDSWKFEATFERPRQMDEELHSGAQLGLQEPSLPCGNTESPGSPRKGHSAEYLDFLDYALKAVEVRSKRSECKILISRLRLSLRRLDISLNGFGKALVEEAQTAVELDIPDKFWVDHVMVSVEKRSVRPEVKGSLNIARTNLRQIDHEFPGFNAALVQELKGRMKKKFPPNPSADI